MMFRCGSGRAKICLEENNAMVLEKVNTMALWLEKTEVYLTQGTVLIPNYCIFLLLFFYFMTLGVRNLP